MPPQERRLSDTQLKTVAEVQGLLTSLPGRKLVLLEGLSGSGKSAVINHVKGSLDPNSVAVAEGLSMSFSGGEPADYTRDYFKNEKVLSTITPREIPEVRKGASKYFPDFEIVTPVLRGMTLRESVDFIRALRGDTQHNLEDDLLAKFSLGLPLLAQQLVADPQLNEGVAAHIAGRHLYQQIDVVSSSWTELNRDIERYLQFMPDHSVFAAAKKGSGSVYDPVGSVLGKRDQLKAKGVQEESPLFLAAESVDIYNKMLRSRDHDQTRIDIFVPELKDADFQRVAQALGFAEYIGPNWDDVGDISQMDLMMLQDEATRFKTMFGQIYRKSAIWYRNLKGDFGFGQYESKTAKKYAEKAEQDFLAGDLPLKPTTDATVGRLFFHKHAHEEQPYDPAGAGWAVESMLQQRGIAYMVNNPIFGKNYVYDPARKAIDYTDYRLVKHAWE